MRHRRVKFVSIIAVAVIGLAACGGSKSDSNESTQDTAASENSTPVDEAAMTTAFCKVATDEGINAKNLADDAQVEEVAKQMSARADVLASLEKNSPSAVKADVGVISEAATAMADALTADPTLANFNEVVQKYTTPDLETASKNVDDFIAKNCEG